MRQRALLAAHLDNVVAEQQDGPVHGLRHLIGLRLRERVWEIAHVGDVLGSDPG